MATPVSGFLSENQQFFTTQEEATHEDAREALYNALTAAGFKTDAFFGFITNHLDAVGNYVQAYREVERVWQESKDLEEANSDDTDNSEAGSGESVTERLDRLEHGIGGEISRAFAGVDPTDDAGTEANIEAVQ